MRNFLFVNLFSLLSLSIFLLVSIYASHFSDQKSFVVVSGSMEPAVPTGSIIYTSQKNNYSLNDIVSFSKNDKVITHRIVGKEKIAGRDYFVTQGDANSLSDTDLVTSSQIVGSVDLSLPFLGQVIIFLKSPFGFAAAIVLPAIALSLINTRREMQIAYN